MPGSSPWFAPLALVAAALCAGPALAAPPQPGEVVARCWLEATSVKCQIHPGSVGSTLTMQFTKFDKTVEHALDCCGVDPLSADLRKRTDCSACEVRSVTTLPGGAFPVVLTLTGVVDGVTHGTAKLELTDAASIPADAALQVVVPKP